jgi:hypothetical protein
MCFELHNGAITKMRDFVFFFSKFLSPRRTKSCSHVFGFLKVLRQMRLDRLVLCIQSWVFCFFFSNDSGIDATC